MEALSQPRLITSNIYCCERGAWGLANGSWAWQEELPRKNHVWAGKLRENCELVKWEGFLQHHESNPLVLLPFTPPHLPLSASKLTLQLLTSDKTGKMDGTRHRRWPLPSSQGGGIFLAGTAACHFPSLSWKGNVLGLLGCCLSSRAPAPACGVSSVIWRSSRESKEQVTSLTRRLPPRCCAESRAFPGSALLRWLGHCPAPLRRGLCDAPQPEAVKLSCWLIKAGWLGRPICSQVNCVAIFSLWQAYKKLPSVLPKDGRVVSCARVCIPSLLSWRHNSQHGVTLRLPCVGIKDKVTPSPMSARWTLAKHPLLLLHFWQLPCPSLSLMSPLAAAIRAPPYCNPGLSSAVCLV